MIPWLYLKYHKDLGGKCKKKKRVFLMPSLSSTIAYYICRERERRGPILKLRTERGFISSSSIKGH